MQPFQSDEAAGRPKKRCDPQCQDAPPDVAGSVLPAWVHQAERGPHAIAAAGTTR